MVSEPKDQQEPSMEEILSSIRKIIADEESEERSGIDRTPDDDERATDEEDDDVLELTEVVRESGEVVEFEPEKEREPEPEHEDEAASAADEIPEGEEVELTPDQRDEPIPEERPASPPTGSQPTAAEGLSAAAAGAAAGSFGKLHQAMREAPAEQGAAASGRTVEQFVADMLRPMLHEWLEENLPPIVERLVQEEIEKLAKRAELL